MWLFGCLVVGVGVGVEMDVDVCGCGAEVCPGWRLGCGGGDWAGFDGEVVWRSGCGWYDGAFVDDGKG